METFVGGIITMGADTMGEKNARRYLPLIGSFCAGLFGRKLGPLGASYITVSCLSFAFFIALFTFYEVSLLNCCVYIKLVP